MQSAWNARTAFKSKGRTRSAHFRGLFREAPAHASTSLKTKLAANALRIQGANDKELEQLGPNVTCHVPQQSPNHFSLLACFPVVVLNSNFDEVSA